MMKFYILCRTRECCEMVSGRLIAKYISAKAYHAGLKNNIRISYLNIFYGCILSKIDTFANNWI